MNIRVAINGYGRIGRNILRALYESNKKHNIDIVAINDLSNNLNTTAHLTKFDSVHGKFNCDIQIEKNTLIINGDRITMFSDRNPENIPWGDLKVDVVLECTGAFTSKEKAMVHIKSGARKVLISAPGGNDVDATIVFGVNHNTLKSAHKIVSNASCTTNCLAPIVKILNDKIGIENGLMTTIHSYTNDQVLTDVSHKDIRRARSATMNMIPTKTGAAAAVGLILPELSGKLDGISIRVPTINVSLVDLSFISKNYSNTEEINNFIKEAAHNEFKGILEYSSELLVSSDHNHNSSSSIFDSSLTKVSGKLVKVYAWYDNEWGFSNRMLDTTVAMMLAK
ncbi:D-erythrose-4-phosphate dehydrogenase [Candidatus Kinetoplastibacterium sorsogonicusi]|uniref:Glyceraldehyde-3-phosphate dehydrogenase n=1 Tax=Candidatus Kinetoplastidibacterium kentomonadis TaxID=1576550 RepID=A0A3Q8EU12_9PROT|nr:type I glyceraldehyde-3-phosphate dehydrogenase [Candidatus Kinetoplastibacterium sorsogonicusi]AWD32264.1 D-erythrose-4-phosphate dehydrogenase [Candidatus Kinetoplastibacterium sorsogonicusi]